MAEYAGVLEKIYEDSGTNTKGRPFVKMSFKVAGAPKAFGGFVNQKNETMLRSVAEGDMVRVTTVMNGQYENLEKIERIKQDSIPKAAPEKSSTPPTGHQPKPSDAIVSGAVSRIDDKDFRITYLACRRDAIEFVTALVAQGALKLGTKESDKADNFYKAVQRYALAFAHDAWNVRPSDAAKLEVEAPAKAEKAATPKYEE